MKRSGMLVVVSLCVMVVLCGMAAGGQEGQESLQLVEARKIWDQAEHNAFTDLVRFKDRWFCVFREGKGHVSPDGALRVITSSDGAKWESAALLQSDRGDLRDAKITVTPEGRLMLIGAIRLSQPTNGRHQTVAWFSEDGTNWDKGHDIGEAGFWLWRITWHKGKAYGMGYSTAEDRASRFLRLYTSEDGVQYRVLVDRLFDVGSPNETSIVFEGETAYCLLRREGSDGQPGTGMLGVSQPPYKEWQWKDLGMHIGGPHMIRLPDGRYVVAVRMIHSPERIRDGGVRTTSLCWIEPAAGKLTECLKLPSGGDTSYAGLVWHDGLLWVSYYSSHEGKTSIYLAKVKVVK